MIYISFNIKSDFSGYETKEQLEEIYQTVYRPLLKLLNTHQNITFSFSFTGPQVEFLKKRHKEFISLSRDLITRHQLEMLGGGYFNPVFPLITAADRNCQIDLLTSEIRQNFGKRPRGMSLFLDCWDPNLVSTLQLSGIEYVLLDSSMINSNKKKFLPLVMNELGKSVEILPYYNNFKPQNDEDLESWVLKIKKSVEKAAKSSDFTQLFYSAIVPLVFNHKEIKNLIENNWFENLSDFLCFNEEISTCNISSYRKNNKVRMPAFISCGIASRAVDFINDLKNENNRYTDCTVYDLFEAYPLGKNLYNRMLYIGMLINQYKSDKLRKEEARMKLWQAQNGSNLISDVGKLSCDSSYRQKAYKILMEAEKILRQDSNFTESICCFDYNGDGLDEYVCRMQNYFSYISPVSGAIQELDILKNTGNYADNLSRKELFEGECDNYERGIFVDHVFSEQQFDLYVQGKACGNGIFSKIQYEEVKFNLRSHEITMQARAVLAYTKQKIYLRKKYIINSTGMTVQYVLRNESNRPLNIKFAVESNFAHTNFDSQNVTYYNIEAVENEDVKNIYPEKIMEQTLKNVSVVRLTDTENGISFAFEPNESCGYFYEPLTFYRPAKNESLVKSHLTFVSTLFWDINLGEGMETEKTINFAITSVRKQKYVHL